MSRAKRRRQELTGRELDLMEALWELGGGSVGAVRTRLEGRGIELAYTSVQTMLNRLVEKGAVEREKEGRAYRYRPAVRRPSVAGRSVGELISRFFGGSPEALARYLVRERLEGDEVESLRRFLDEGEGP